MRRHRQARPFRCLQQQFGWRSGRIAQMDGREKRVSRRSRGHRLLLPCTTSCTTALRLPMPARRLPSAQGADCTMVDSCTTAHDSLPVSHPQETSLHDCIVHRTTSSCTTGALHDTARQLHDDCTTVFRFPSIVFHFCSKTYLAAIFRRDTGFYSSGYLAAFLFCYRILTGGRYW